MTRAAIHHQDPFQISSPPPSRDENLLVFGVFDPSAAAEATFPVVNIESDVSYEAVFGVFSVFGVFRTTAPPTLPRFQFFDRGSSESEEIGSAPLEPELNLDPPITARSQPTAVPPGQ